MVHIVRKKIGNHEYLYLQKSYHIKGKNKKRTEHVAYLGKVGRYTKKELKDAIDFYEEPKNKGKSWRYKKEKK